MSGRIWFGPVGGELIGNTDDGTPVLGDEVGVGPMTEVTDHFTAITFGDYDTTSTDDEEQA